MTRQSGRWPLTAGLTLTIAVVVFVVLFGQIGVDSTFDLLAEMERRVALHFWPVMVSFVVAFAILAAIALPIGSLFCLVGGYLFGITPGFLASLVGSMAGATLTFYLVRLMGGARLRERLSQGRIDRLLKLLERDATWYLVMLRIVPIAPFFFINAAAALARISGPRFFLATLAGLIPTTLIYAAVGNGLGSLLEARSMMGPDLLLQPSIGLPLLGLVALILASFLAHRIIRRPEP
jgi:uncharacterized membrane protein YdjX (TVP38/TMEM64 family)